MKTTLRARVNCSQTTILGGAYSIVINNEMSVTINEPHRDKTNKMACAPSEDSD